MYTFGFSALLSSLLGHKWISSLGIRIWFAYWWRHTNKGFQILLAKNLTQILSWHLIWKSMCIWTSLEVFQDTETFQRTGPEKWKTNLGMCEKRYRSPALNNLLIANNSRCFCSNTEIESGERSKIKHLINSNTYWKTKSFCVCLYENVYNGYKLLLAICYPWNQSKRNYAQL